MAQPEEKEQKISYEIPQELEGGAYVNQAFILHSQKEFILDLGIGLPNGKVKIQSRLITNPIDAKAIMMALQQNIANYEKKFGEIKLPQGGLVPETPQQLH